MYFTGAFQGEDETLKPLTYLIVLLIFKLRCQIQNKLFYLAFIILVLLCLKVILFFNKDLKFEYFVLKTNLFSGIRLPQFYTVK